MKPKSKKSPYRVEGNADPVTDEEKRSREDAWLKAEEARQKAVKQAALKKRFLEERAEAKERFEKAVAESDAKFEKELKEYQEASSHNRNENESFRKRTKFYKTWRSIYLARIIRGESIESADMKAYQAAQRVLDAEPAPPKLKIEREPLSMSLAWVGGYGPPTTVKEMMRLWRKQWIKKNGKIEDVS